MTTANIADMHNKSLNYRTNRINWARPDHIGFTATAAYFGIAALIVVGLGLIGLVMA